MTEQNAELITWRPMGLDDISRIAEWFWNFDDAALFDRALPVPVSVDGMRESWRRSLEQTAPPAGYWFMAEAQDGTPLGICGLEKISYIQGDGVLPFFVAEHFRSRGLATAMSVAMLDLAFNRLRLHRLTTYYRADNVPSAKALSRLGFRTEGTCREGWFSEGKRQDIIIAGILASDWQAERERVIDSVKATCNLTFTPTCWKSERGEQL
ncbi:GNAT family protein [uncultured Roseobacter sp.]|uniref:GNAT family N-acetyltransferase n=1 Tax=uncultured Roseobacter sp. TaxID=114847 RepID=UPI00261E011C|nr:GNAT family protein [uncultured Roseobacter sp.]